MSTEQNKEIGHRILQALNDHNLAPFDTITSADAVDHVVPPGWPETVASTKKFLGMFLAAFPDLKYTLEEEVAEREYVVQRVTGSGTMKGELMGIPATGKKAVWSEIHTVRFANERVVEHWGNIDQMGMLVQLGVVPPPPGAA